MRCIGCVQVRDLEKQRFVLNYKVNQLQGEKEPREAKLLHAQERLLDVDKNLLSQVSRQCLLCSRRRHVLWVRVAF
jgi:hypothetical protein